MTPTKGEALTAATVKASGVITERNRTEIDVNCSTAAAPATTAWPSGRVIGVDMSAPFGVYVDGVRVAEFINQADAEELYQRLRTH